MRDAHLVCEQGISGDLLLGAFLDAGASLEVVRDAIGRLGLDGVTIHADGDVTAGVTATRARIVTTAATPRLERWGAIEDLLAASELDAPVGERVIAVMRRLAEVEATVHGRTVEEVRLHELGDADTIVDVTAVCAALDDLAIARLTCGPVALGGGSVTSDHGPLAVPPPAVLELLRGFDVHGGAVRRELTTPTGAALVATLATPVPSVPPMGLEGHGRGVVGEQHAISTLMVMLGRRAGIAGPDTGPDLTSSLAAVVEATVDDLNPELVPVVLDALRRAGADDAWATPALMKKGRSGHTLTALCSETSLHDVRETLLAESTTIGLRVHLVTKQALARRTVRIDVMGHEVRVKVSSHHGTVIRVKPEIDDVRAVADVAGRPVREVLAAAEEIARRDLDRARAD